MTDRIELAARNNALWCDAVCRSHGLSGTFDAAAWSSSVRTPPLYPDAVTLTEATSEADVLHRIDASDGASVKDSWAGLDLSVAGFSQLLIGEWLWRNSESEAGAGSDDTRLWRTIDSAAEMARWSKEWAANPEDASILGPTLLDNESVHVLAAAEGDDDFAAGCIVNVTGEVAGVSNLFCAHDDAARTWRGATSAASVVAPGRALVGWESGNGIEAARAAGFELLGPLTVWVR